MERLSILVSVVALVATACASGDTVSTAVTSVTPPDTVVLTVEQSGGCMMMGPNCPTYVVRANGQVEIFRTGDADDAVDVTRVDMRLMTDLANEIGSSDLEAIRARLDEGECRGCYDGIDTAMEFETVSGIVRFDSMDEELSSAEPLFAAVWAIVETAAAEMTLPMEQRG